LGCDESAVLRLTAYIQRGITPLVGTTSDLLFHRRHRRPSRPPLYSKRNSDRPGHRAGNQHNDPPISDLPFLPGRRRGRDRPHCWSGCGEKVRDPPRSSVKLELSGRTWEDAWSAKLRYRVAQVGLVDHSATDRLPLPEQPREQHPGRKCGCHKRRCGSQM
jgi:hypothetical protein